MWWTLRILREEKMMTPVWFKVEVDEFVFYKPVGDEAKLALPVDVGE
jgi:hypothetical protein